MMVGTLAAILRPPAAGRWRVAADSIPIRRTAGVRIAFSSKMEIDSTNSTWAYLCTGERIRRTTDQITAHSPLSITLTGCRSVPYAGEETRESVRAIAFSKALSQPSRY